MFENLLKALKAVEGTHSYSSTIEADAEGYIDKECPNENCLSKFKVKAVDWAKNFSDDKVFCPYCGFEAPAKSWYTTEQVQKAQEQAINSVRNTLNDALRNDVKSFNSNQKKGFITMSMKLSGFEHYPILPIKALEIMEQKHTCQKCGSSYSVVGTSTFCPCCGYNSFSNTFSNSISTIKAKLKMIPILLQDNNQISKDETQMIIQSLLDNSFSELVGAFQVLCTSIFKECFPSIMLKKNVFQRLGDGSLLWKEAVGFEYKDWLSSNELSLLNKCFQQRHIIEHNNGIIDSDYISKTADHTYSIGQRLIVKENEVVSFLQVIEKIGFKMIDCTLGNQ